uniref:Uncharacterized protein n=1 Tax=Coccidioides posadasii RMSCC 3488 TaxID=454284 RepID=A0A0J6FBV0_COCPO|nr:hypothetical protein CPAG_06822 [Coccidioides posadasii RMSCC 3488]
MASSVTHDREQSRFKNTYLFGKYSMSYWPCDELETVALLFAVAKICIPGAGLLNLYVSWVFEGVLRDKDQESCVVLPHGENAERESNHKALQVTGTGCHCCQSGDGCPSSSIDGNGRRSWISGPG